MSTLFDELGGEDALRPIIDDFVRTMVKDTMIGFFFEGVDVDRLVELELQFTARFLGAKLPYAGRPMRAAHARHPIMGGQFDRRRKLLEEAIVRHGVAPHIKAAWLEHVDKLRGQITRDAAGDCNTPDAPDGAPVFKLLS